jgi:hypothetical protein
MLVVTVVLVLAAEGLLYNLPDLIELCDTL